MALNAADFQLAAGRGIAWSLLERLLEVRLRCSAIAGQCFLYPEGGLSGYNKAYRVSIMFCKGLALISFFVPR